jgi:hypothetical protein
MLLLLISVENPIFTGLARTVRDIPRRDRIMKALKVFMKSYKAILMPFEGMIS